MEIKDIKGIKSKIVKKDDGIYEIPKEAIEGMRQPCRIIASEKILNDIDEETIKQLTRVALLSGLGFPPIGLPDIHLGYGVPIGSVLAFKATKDYKKNSKESGIISAGMVGFDINCGISLFKTTLKKEAVAENKERIGKLLLDRVPTGVGSKSAIKLSEKEFSDVLKEGAMWCVKRGLASKEDLEHMEDNGFFELDDKDLRYVSKEAIKRGINQLGTLGSGNHFLELSYVKKIFNKEKAKKYSLEEGDVCLMIHTGSRGFGHQIASDYLKIQLKAAEKYGLQIIDKQLAGAPIGSEEASSYLEAMKAAANFSYANKLILASIVEKLIKELKSNNQAKALIPIYTISHNICKKEIINGEELFIHRKGATRAYPNSPVIVAGSMGSSSFLLEGTEKAVSTSLASSCHGAGRALSRTDAKNRFKIKSINEELKDKGIAVFSKSQSGIIEEAPSSYKSSYDVIEAVEEAGISEKIAEFYPIIVIKG